MTVIVDLNKWSWGKEETSGDSDKQWLVNPEDGSDWLFKPNKANRSPDEASSEYVASEIAAALDLPAAHVMVADRYGQRGCISRNVVTDEHHGLVEAAVFLTAITEDFDPKDKWSRGHTQANLSKVLDNLDPPVGGQNTFDAFSLFAGYLIFDALIGNTDRHSKNWAIETTLEGRDALAPSYDHATSLAVSSRGKARAQLLEDRSKIAGFAQKATAHRFEDGRGISLVDYAGLFTKTFAAEAVEYWAESIARLDLAWMRNIVDSSHMTEEAATLASEVLAINQERIVQCLRSQ